MDPTTLPTIDAHVAVTAAPECLLLDVREYEEWMSGHAPTAVHIPMSELAGRVGELDRNGA